MQRLIEHSVSSRHPKAMKFERNAFCSSPGPRSYQKTLNYEKNSLENRRRPFHHSEKPQQIAPRQQPLHGTLPSSTANRPTPLRSSQVTPEQQPQEVAQVDILQATNDWFTHLNLQVSKAIRLRQLYWKENSRCFENREFKFVILDPKEEERLFLFSLEQIVIQSGLDAVQTLTSLNQQQEIVITEVKRRADAFDLQNQRIAFTRQQAILKECALKEILKSSRQACSSQDNHNSRPRESPQLVLTEPTPQRASRGGEVPSSHRNQSYRLSLSSSSSSPFRDGSYASAPSSRGSSPSPEMHRHQHQHQVKLSRHRPPLPQRSSSDMYSYYKSR